MFGSCTYKSKKVCFNGDYVSPQGAKYHVDELTPGRLLRGPRERSKWREFTRFRPNWLPRHVRFGIMQASTTAVLWI